MDDKTYRLSLAGVVDVALQPIKSFKDILIRLDENGLAVDPVFVGVVLESLLEASERQLNTMQPILNAEFGRVLFQHATTAHPAAKTGEIVGLEVDHA
ncbi:hypothetical protein [Solidesulfovibrio sp.]